MRRSFPAGCHTNGPTTRSRPMGTRTRLGIRLGTAIALVIMSLGMSLGAPRPAVALDSCLVLGLTLNRETIAVGEGVHVSVPVANPCSARAVDVYVVIVLPPTVAASVGCPGSLALAFVANGGSAFALRCGSASVATFPPYMANVTVPSGIDFTVDDVLALTWPAGAPSGTYTLAILATTPGAFADGALDLGDILTLSTRELTN